MKSIQLRSKTTIILIVSILYILSFKPLTDSYGVITAPLVTIPVVLAGWFFGKRSGFFASLIAIFINAILFIISLRSEERRVGKECV